MSPDQALIDAGPEVMEIDPEELSFRNMVHFYSEELKQIQKGTKAMKVISRTTRAIMVREGALVSACGYDPEGGKIRRWMELTTRALSVLEGIER